MDNNEEIMKEETTKDESEPVDDAVVIDEPGKSSSNKTSQDDMITIDENGVRWCTVKYAASFLGKSVATIRRYAQEKRFRSKQEASPSNYGYTYLISVDDLVLMKNLLDSNEKKSSVSHSDTAFKLLSALNNLDLPALQELKDKVENLQDRQIVVADVLTNIVSQNSELKSIQNSVGESLSKISTQSNEILQHFISENENLSKEVQRLTKENQKLTERINELVITVDRQKATISELQSRGFFARIANKPPMVFSDSLPSNSFSLSSENSEEQ